MSVIGGSKRTRERVLVADQFHSRDGDGDSLAGSNGDGGLLATSARRVEDSPAPLVRGSVAPAEDLTYCEGKR